MLETSNGLLRYLIGRPWPLIRFNRRSLITSDSPVGLVRNRKDEPWRGVGYMTAWGITFPLTRKLGLLMGSIEELIDLGIPIKAVHEGRADSAQAGSTTLERFFNDHTAANASEWLFHHPDDEQFLPAALPEPMRVTVDIAGNPIEFTGEPWFKPPVDGSPVAGSTPGVPQIGRLR
jgi:hypothetical protein